MPSISPDQSDEGSDDLRKSSHLDDDQVKRSMSKTSTFSTPPPLRKKGSRIHAVEVSEGPQAHRKHRSVINAKPTYLNTNSMSTQALDLMNNQWYERFFFAVIVVNAGEMGLSIAYDEEKTTWLMFDIVFAVLYTFEAVITLTALGHTTFYYFWKALQVCVTVFAVGDVAMSVSGLGEDYVITSKALNSLRLLLLGKMFALNRETKIIVISMVRSLKALRGVLIVILVICYGCTLGVYSIVGKKGEEYDEKGVIFGTSPHETYFGSIPRTTLTLFSLLILSEWDSVARAVYEVQPYFVFFFVCFTVFLTFGLMNVLVGIIVDTVNQIHSEHDEKLRQEELKAKKATIDKLVEMVFGDDDDITCDEFLEVTQDNEDVAEILREFKVPWHFTYGDLFTIIDDDQDGHVTKTELSDGLFSLVAGDETARFCLSQLGISKTHFDLVHLRDMVSEMGRNQQVIANHLFNPNGNGASDLPAGLITNVSDGAKAYQSAAAKRQVPIGKIGKRGVPKPEVSTEDIWTECYSTLHSAVEKHCQRELEIAWQSFRGDWSADISSQEYFVIRNKLHSAVSCESAIELRKAIDHAIAAGVDSSLLAIELTYNDMLKRSQGERLPAAEVRDAMEKGDWSSALYMIVESALTNGADKHILANVITRVSDASNVFSTFQLERAVAPYSNGTPPVSGRSQLGPQIIATPLPSGKSDLGREDPTSPVPSLKSGKSGDDLSVQGRAANIRRFETRPKFFKDGGDDAEAQVYVLSVLHAEAYKHSQQELSKAWEALPAAAEQRNMSRKKHPPLSEAEEFFFIYNQMLSAVDRQSLPDLQRALNQAVMAGLDMRTLDVEVAYRDALARYFKATSHTIRLAVDAFRRREWYLALDLVIQMSLARGADRQSLLRTLTKIYAEPGGDGRTWI